MTKEWLSQDPQAQREAEKYDNPVPSREFILEFMQEHGAPIGHAALCKALGVVDEESVEAVARRLKAMCRDGQLMSNRKNEFGLLRKMDLIPGAGHWSS